MAKTVQMVRHTTANADAFTGKEGQITVDTDRNEIRVHDGITAGGVRVTTKTINDGLYQTLHAILTSLAGQTAVADKLPYFSGADTFSLLTFLSWARTFLGAATVAAGNTALGLGTGDSPTFTDLNLTGNLIPAIGKGIDFSATADAGGKASELFDDYEEGTWTPTFIAASTPGTPTYSTQEGEYTKIGNWVFCSASLLVTSISTGSGGVTIGGLPYTAAAIQPAGGGLAQFGSGLNLGTAKATHVNVQSGASVATLYNPDLVTGHTQLQASEWSSNGRMDFSFSYKAA